MTLETRLRQLEAQLEERRQRNDPRAFIRLALQLALMTATVPAGIDGSKARQEQLDRVAELEHEFQITPSAFAETL